MSLDLDPVPVQSLQDDLQRHLPGVRYTLVEPGSGPGADSYLYNLILDGASYTIPEIDAILSTLAGVASSTVQFRLKVVVSDDGFAYTYNKDGYLTELAEMQRWLLARDHLWAGFYRSGYLTISPTADIGYVDIHIRYDRLLQVTFRSDDAGIPFLINCVHGNLELKGLGPRRKGLPREVNGETFLREPTLAGCTQLLREWSLATSRFKYQTTTGLGMAWQDIPTDLALCANTVCLRGDQLRVPPRPETLAALLFKKATVEIGESPSLNSSYLRLLKNNYQGAPYESIERDFRAETDTELLSYAAPKHTTLTSWCRCYIREQDPTTIVLDGVLLDAHGITTLRSGAILEGIDTVKLEHWKGLTSFSGFPPTLDALALTLHLDPAVWDTFDLRVNNLTLRHLSSDELHPNMAKAGHIYIEAADLTTTPSFETFSAFLRARTTLDMDVEDSMELEDPGCWLNVLHAYLANGDFLQLCHDVATLYPGKDLTHLLEPVADTAAVEGIVLGY